MKWLVSKRGWKGIFRFVVCTFSLSATSPHKKLVPQSRTHAHSPNFIAICNVALKLAAVVWGLLVRWLVVFSAAAHVAWGRIFSVFDCVPFYLCASVSEIGSWIFNFQMQESSATTAICVSTKLVTYIFQNPMVDHGTGRVLHWPDVQICSMHWRTSGTRHAKQAKTQTNKWIPPS